jgi:uncharacterized protein YbjT (DUF2867 family)
MERILLTGATGYVGGRLLVALAQRGYAVRCMARRPEDLQARVPAGVEVVHGDVSEPETLKAALEGIGTAFYLVHSMGAGPSFEEKDRIGAQNFASAADAAGVQRIVYLGGLGDDSGELSPHLRSRHEVGALLRRGEPQLIELRASIVIGSGSLSFEMVRSLVEKLPIMTTPKWVQVLTQPIAVQDLIEYLVQSVTLEVATDRVIEIGGAEVVSYADLMRAYAQHRGLRRFIVPVPVLSPRLSSLWLGLVTPLYARIGRQLVDSLRHPTVVTDTAAETLFPSIHPVGVDEAIARAQAEEATEAGSSRWSDSLSAGNTARSWGGVRFGSRLVDSRSAHVAVPPGLAFEPIRRIGGETGWYYADFLWKLRGFIDLLVGGVGIRRGRRSQERVQVGDVIDWWRVEAYEEGRRLRLLAEMKVPGRAWLEFRVEAEDGGSNIHQIAIFDPKGLAGLMYWYGIYPIHALIFAGMLRRIVERARLSTPAPRSWAGGSPAP